MARGLTSRAFVLASLSDRPTAGWLRNQTTNLSLRLVLPAQASPVLNRPAHISDIPSTLDVFPIEVHPIGQEHLGKRASKLIVAVEMEGASVFSVIYRLPLY
jgi:hypothetical protein